MPDKNMRVSVVGNLVKTCNENLFVGGEDNKCGRDHMRRSRSSDSGNSSGSEWEYPPFLGRECREWLDSGSSGGWDNRDHLWIGKSDATKVSWGGVKHARCTCTRVL